MIYQVDLFDHAWSIRTNLSDGMPRKKNKESFSRKGNSLGRREEYTENTCPEKENSFRRVYHHCLPVSIRWIGCSETAAPWNSTVDWGPRLGKCNSQHLLGAMLSLQSCCPSQPLRKLFCMRDKGWQVWTVHEMLAHACSHHPSAPTAANGCYSPPTMEFRLLPPL